MTQIWSTIIIALLAAIPATIAAVAVLITALRLKRAVNGRMDEMLKLARAEASATARLEEIDKVAQRRKEDYDPIR